MRGFDVTPHVVEGTAELGSASGLTGESVWKRPQGAEHKYRVLVPRGCEKPQASRPERCRAEPTRAREGPGTPAEATTERRTRQRCDQTRDARAPPTDGRPPVRAWGALSPALVLFTCLNTAPVTHAGEDAGAGTRWGPARGPAKLVERGDECPRL